METSTTSGYTRFLHPDLEVDFLAPQTGRGVDEPFKVPELHLEAQRLRYLNFIQDYTILVSYDGVMIRVPEPAVFMLLKFILSTVRPDNSLKKEKDLQTAIELSDFLLSNEVQIQKIKQIHSDMPRKWRQKLRVILDAHYPELLSVLSA